MDYRGLGRSGLKVSPLCLGTMNFGPRTSEGEAFRILDAALDAGINFVDTANQYGGHLGVGATEALLGRWFASNPGKRDKVVLATKVHEPMSDDVNDRGLSARHIRHACEASLVRMGIDHIDLYQMHHIDRSVPVDETWQAMERLIAQDKISYVGTSNFPGWAIAQLNERALARGGLGTVSEQSLYNLLERRVELEVLPACEAYGAGVIVWSPLAGGLLAGRTTSSGGRRSEETQMAQRREHETALAGFEALAGDLSTSPAALAIAWLLHQPGVTSAIIGPATFAQFESLREAADIALDEAALAALDALFPPVGQAPEAYAW